MRIETQLIKRGRAVSAVREAYSTARICGTSSADLHAKLQKLEAEILAGCPQVTKSYVQGYSMALRDAMYADHLVYGGFFDGVFYSTHRTRADYYDANGIEPSDWNDKATRKGHYWDCGTRGMLPYYADPV